VAVAAVQKHGGFATAACGTGRLSLAPVGEPVPCSANKGWLPGALLASVGVRKSNLITGGCDFVVAAAGGEILEPTMLLPSPT
jgi:hypothetical protein